MKIQELIDEIVYNISNMIVHDIGDVSKTNASCELDENTFAELFVYFEDGGGGPSPEDPERVISVKQLKLYINGQLTDADDFLTSNDIELAFNN
jgi:heptaprenylglyceryl phosphate synthase